MMLDDELIPDDIDLSQLDTDPSDWEDVEEAAWDDLIDSFRNE